MYSRSDYIVTSILGSGIFICLGLAVYFQFYNSYSESLRYAQVKQTLTTYEGYVDKYKLAYDVLPVAEPKKQVNQELDVAKLEKVGFKPSEVTYQPVTFFYFFTLDAPSKVNRDFWVDTKGEVFMR